MPYGEVLIHYYSWVSTIRLGTASCTPANSLFYKTKNQAYAPTATVAPWEAPPPLRPKAPLYGRTAGPAELL